MAQTSVMLVDDHAVVRQGYRRLIEMEADLVVCAEAASADEACHAAAQRAPDLVLLDLNLGASSGLEALRRMRQRRATLKVLIFSMYDSPAHVTQALRAGAQGYVSKCSAPEELVWAIRRVVQGERVLSPDIAQALTRERPDGEGVMARLTPREFEILRLSVRGDAVHLLAERLHLSPKTVFNHLSNIRAKLEVDSDFQLLQLAARHGLLDAQAVLVD